MPTPITVGSPWPNMTPFAMSGPSQFRPQPPVALDSKDWATDYNEIKSLWRKGEHHSVRRNRRRPPNSGSWSVRRPITPYRARSSWQNSMNVIDSARFMALFAVALTDAYIAVFDAKYHYEFWRPITAIRNGRHRRQPGHRHSRRPGSRSTTRRCIPNIRVHTASRAVRLRASWKRCSAPRTFPKSQ